MSINNKFNLGDRLRRTNQYGDVLTGPVISITAKVSNDYGDRREVYYRVQPEEKGWKGCHCAYSEDQWKKLPESKDGGSHGK